MRIAVKWGVILGVAVCLWTLMLHVLGFYTTNIAAGLKADLVATVLPVGAIALAIRERLRAGPLSFGQVVATAVVVGLISVPITAGFLWWYHHYMNPQWVDYIIEHQRRTLGEAGASADEIEQMVMRQRASATARAQLIGALVGTLIISTVIGLVGALGLRVSGRSRPA
jgi:hypothetical protein